MNLNYGSFIVDKDKLSHAFRFAMEQRIKFIYVFSNAPDEVYECFGAIDHGIDHNPKLILWEKQILV